MNNIIWKLLSLIFEPSNSKYHQEVLVTKSNIANKDIPLSKILLIEQPDDSETIGIHIEYKLPKYSLSHTAQFQTINEKGETTTLLYLEAEQIKNKNTIYFIHNINNILHKTGEIVFMFSDGHLPTSNTYQYRVILNQYEIT